jgi:hypothetical protein
VTARPPAAALALVLAIACGRPAPGPAPGTIGGEKEHDSMTQTSVRWRRHVVAPIGLSFDTFEEGPAAEGVTEPGFHYFVQTSGPAQIAARAGTGQDLASWRAIYGPPRRASFGPETPTTLCGAPAVRQEVTVEEERATGGFPDAQGRIVPVDKTDPATVHVAVSAQLRGQPLLVVWSVHQSERAAYRDAEAHFFSSIECPG